MIGPRVRSNWQVTVLVCAKCSKKLDGGFGPKRRLPLAKALRKHLGLKKGRKAPLGIVETKCLGVCPFGAVTVVNPAQGQDWFIVRSGSDLDEVAMGLGLAQPVA
jgi:predicted metal-binding protein